MSAGAIALPAPAPARAYVGIHDGHNAAVAVLRAGKIELALQEERITRVKNQGDAPGAAGRVALDLAGGAPCVALNGRYMSYQQWSREAVLGDYARSGGWRARCKQPLKDTFVDRLYQRRRAAARAGQLAAIGVRQEQLAPVEHHRAHAAAAYYTAPRRDLPLLVLTCDGSGDRLSATVSIGRDGELTRLAEVSEHDSLGRLYALITEYLGMLPLEHEYKVMGLAPYAAASPAAAAVATLLESLFEFPPNQLGWRRRPGVPSMYAANGFLARLLAGRRFDHVAAGAQLFIERMLAAWVTRAIRETGIPRLACAGGVFMNVKANLALLELDQVEDMWVMPSCGDESNAIGAACHEAARAGERIDPLGPIYYGDPITDGEAQEALETAARGGARLRFHWTRDIERLTAQQLAAGRIVARAAGRMEFGARALGNRSILARADQAGVVRTINEAIKNRDFWMPFAPSVLARRAAGYYGKPKSIRSPYMMFAFRSRPEARAALAAAQHPSDFTTRAHEVYPEHNPGYHRLLEEYESLTGEGIVLNTSFNLHGEPIVYRARDAVGVLLRSGLEHLALANWWVEKIA